MMSCLRSLFLVVLAVLMLQMGACGGSDVGKRCGLNETNIVELQRLSLTPNNASVVMEPSFECETGLNFCFGSDYDEAKKNDLGYCTKVCLEDSDCPSPGFTCAAFFPVPPENLPPQTDQAIRDLANKRICLRVR